MSGEVEQVGYPELSVTPAVSQRYWMEYLQRLLAALVRWEGEEPSAFVHDGHLASVDWDTGRVQPHTAATLREAMRTYPGVDREYINSDMVPDDRLRTLLNAGSWPGVPELHRVTRVPYLFSGSTGLTSASDLGYFDRRTGICCLVSEAVAEAWGVADELSVDEARRLLLDELLGEFPFVGESDRAHAVALVLATLLRMIIDGPTPLFVVDAPRHRTGKSLLVEACLSVSEGEGVRATRLPTSEDGRERMIDAALRAGASSVWLDNVRQYVDSETLALVLTARRWMRPTVRHGAEPLENLVTWVLTQNGAGLSTELTKRAVLIRLDAKTEHPERRPIRRQQPLMSWALEHRAEVLGAALRLCLAWDEAGRPLRQERRMGGFEGWEQVMGGVLEVAGIPGFLGNVDARDETVDVEEGALRELVLSIVENVGVGVDAARTSAELVKEASTWVSDPSRLGSKNPQSAGKLLRKALNKPLAGYVLRQEERRSAANGWYVDPDLGQDPSH